MYYDNFDVIVIGGGHAGVEAACAARKILGTDSIVGIATFMPENIGALSCNPSIGGVGKGHIVKEIDAMGGAMGYVSDRACIHFKMLNSSKGPAVWGPRMQVDRELYKNAMFSYVMKQGVKILCTEVVDLMVHDNSVCGVVIPGGETIKCSAIVLTTGTFLGGKIHIGDKSFKGGRLREPPSTKLAITMKSLGFNVIRLKTGTPPRLRKDSIRWDELEVQPGDNPVPFSIRSNGISVPQVNCFIAYTNEKSHEIIRSNILLSPMYNGGIDYDRDNITSMGPRYCPSIEDKVTRFADKNRHQIFLEPEGLNSDLIYPNGISTSLPHSVQLEFIRSIKGLQDCEIMQSGYAIEYDALDPRDLYHTLESKKLARLYLAGQINGTTGYEEAAGQGLIAGANAALQIMNKEELILQRSESYIGVMIDDIVAKGVSEPYRMMTGRAEYRIRLRADNADERLTKKARNVGLISEDYIYILSEKYDAINKSRELLDQITLSPQEIARYGIKISQDGVRRSLYKVLGFPDIKYEDMREIAKDCGLDISISHFAFLRAESVYKLLDTRLEMDMKMLETEQDMTMPKEIDYGMVAGLSTELKQKLGAGKPVNIAEAKAIKGMTPAAIIALIIHIKKYYKSQ